MLVRLRAWITNESRRINDRRLIPISGTLVSARQRGNTRTVSRFAWAFLAYMLGVILWGAYVRASGSGAGCGNHWPLCNGEVIPTLPEKAMLIEFIHRVTSGLALISVLALVYLTVRATVRRAWARTTAVLSAVLTLNEAFLGALLVLLQRVGNDQSATRAVLLSFHLANTLLLIGSIALTALWLTDPPARGELSVREAARFVIGLLAAVLIEVGGALAALGDTLFPAASLRSALASDFSATSHFQLRLRLLHPAMAIVGATYVIWLCATLVRTRAGIVHKLGIALILLAIGQVLLGALNVLMLAPV